LGVPGSEGALPDVKLVMIAKLGLLEGLMMMMAGSRLAPGEL
jgi:hypothetical protein